jgi:hypothetical protein
MEFVFNIFENIFFLFGLFLIIKLIHKNNLANTGIERRMSILQASLNNVISQQSDIVKKITLINSTTGSSSTDVSLIKSIEDNILKQISLINVNDNIDQQLLHELGNLQNQLSNLPSSFSSIHSNINKLYKEVINALSGNVTSVNVTDSDNNDYVQLQKLLETINYKVSSSAGIDSQVKNQIELIESQILTVINILRNIQTGIDNNVTSTTTNPTIVTNNDETTTTTTNSTVTNDETIPSTTNDEKVPSTTNYEITLNPTTITNNEDGTVTSTTVSDNINTNINTDFKNNNGNLPVSTIVSTKSSIPRLLGGVNNLYSFNNASTRLQKQTLSFIPPPKSGIPRRS